MWPFKPKAQIANIEGPGRYQCQAVGESHYQDALNQICGGKCEDGHKLKCIALLVLEPDNPYDSDAVAVTINNNKVGHLSRPHAKALKTVLQRNGLDRVSVKALVVGGWKRDDDDEGHYGVKLDIPLS